MEEGTPEQTLRGEDTRWPALLSPPPPHSLPSQATVYTDHSQIVLTCLFLDVLVRVSPLMCVQVHMYRCTCVFVHMEVRGQPFQAGSAGRRIPTSQALGLQTCTCPAFQCQF